MSQVQILSARHCELDRRIVRVRPKPGPDVFEQVCSGGCQAHQISRVRPTVAQRLAWTEVSASLRSPCCVNLPPTILELSLIHISEPTRRTPISYAVFCLKKKKKTTLIKHKTPP